MKEILDKIDSDFIILNCWLIFSLVLLGIWHIDPICNLNDPILDWWVAFKSG